MRGLRLSLAIIAAITFPGQAFAADRVTASVNAHMIALAWLTGTYNCTQHTMYSNGKSTNDNGTITFSPLQDGWISPLEFPARVTTARDISMSAPERWHSCFPMHSTATRIRPLITAF
jgi:hypothetical protein